MKKTSLLMAILFSLNFNGCVQKTIVTNSNPNVIRSTSIPSNETTHTRVYTTPIETTSQRPQVIPREAIISTPQVMPTHTEVAPSSAGSYHSLQTVQGSILKIQERSNGFVFPQYQNKVVLLQLFGQNCEYCLEEAPILNRMKRKYAGRLQLLAIQAQEPMNRTTSARILRKFQINYPVVDKNEAREVLYFIQTTYGWTGILPYMLLIKDGVTEYSFSGAVSQQELDEAIRSLF